MGEIEKKIGKVTLNYTFYPGKDLYTDGEIEDSLLKAFQTGTQKELLYNSSEWAVLYHVSDIRENLLEWYSFSENAEILEIGSGCGAITGLLSRKAKSVTCIELSEKRSLINAYRNKECKNIEILLGNFQDIIIEKKYDYITLIGVWEYAGLYVSSEQPYLDMLKKVKEYLKPNGKIIVAIENKMGMKYWNGAPEDHVGRLYGGLNDYVGEKNIRTFSKPEIIELLKKAGIDKMSFYYPMPDYKLPRLIYSDKHLPNVGDIRCYKEDYNMDRVYNFYDATAFDQVCRDKMFAYFSNSYLFVCGEDNNESIFATYSRTRRSEYRIATRIVEKEQGKYVVKSALTEDAKVHITNQKKNEQKWINMLSKINYVKGDLISGEYIVPYIDGIDVDTYWYEWRHEPESLVEKVREFIETYLTPTDDDLVPFKMTEDFKKIYGQKAPKESKSLKATNVDLLFSNLKFSQGMVYNFDYEWVFEFEIPYEYVLWRAVAQLYDKYAIYLKRKISWRDFLVAVGISEENIDDYIEMESKFAEYVFGKNRKEMYLKNYQKRAVMQSISFV